MSIKKIKIPNIKTILAKDPPSLKPPYGVYALADEFVETDESGLVINFDKNPTYKTSNYSAISGVIVSISENFDSKYVGGYIPKLGDRILTITNQTIPIKLADKDGTHYKLLLIKEADILALLEPNLELTVNH